MENDRLTTTTAIFYCITLTRQQVLPPSGEDAAYEKAIDDQTDLYEVASEQLQLLHSKSLPSVRNDWACFCICMYV